MKSEDVASLRLPSTTLPEPSGLPAYYLPPLPHLMTSNSFLNPYLFSVLPPFADPMLFTFPLPTSQPSLCAQAMTFPDFPFELKSSAECFSQSHGSSQSTESSKSSPRNSHQQRVSSVESCNATSRLRRGRPQQDITDDSDPSSQKRRHRRLYARQYRAQMRHKVDEVKVLKAKMDEMKRTIEKLEMTLASERREHQHNSILLNSMIQSKLIP